jgi:hypothetical protein
MREREKYRDTLAEIPDVLLTVEDSLEAGNCERETKRVAAWFEGLERVSARVIAEEAIRRGEYQLLRYIKQAAVYAQQLERKNTRDTLLTIGGYKNEDVFKER